MSAIVKTADVKLIGSNSDLTIYTLNEIDATGVEVSEEAILSPFGLDPVCTQMSLYHLPVVTGGETCLKASLTFDKGWNGKDGFVKELNAQFGINVKEEPHPYKPHATTLYVVGQASDVMAFGIILRDQFTSDQLEVDTVKRAIVHPEQIGELLDDAARHIRTSQERQKTPIGFSYGAYQHDWAV